MASRDFTAFVEAQNAAGRGMEREERVKSWLEKIGQLYRQVEGYLAPFTAQGQIRFERRGRQLNEEFLGNYEAPALLIRIGAKEVALEPVGSVVIGAQGRVDLRGMRDERKLVLLPKHVRRSRVRVLTQEEAQADKARTPATGELVWKIVPGPRQDYIDLDEQSLTEAILAVSA